MEFEKHYPVLRSLIYEIFVVAISSINFMNLTNVYVNIFWHDKHYYNISELFINIYTFHINYNKYLLAYCEQFLWKFELGTMRKKKST